MTPDIAPAMGRVIRSIQLNFTSLKPLSAAKMKKVNSMKISPVTAPLSNPFSGVLKPMRQPSSTEIILMAMFTGIITFEGRAANLIITAKMRTSPKDMSVESSTAFKTSVIFPLRFAVLSIPKTMSLTAQIYRTSKKSAHASHKNFRGLLYFVDLIYFSHYNILCFTVWRFFL